MKQLGPSFSRAVVLITGIPAAEKSTVAQVLAERLPRSVHVRGDLFRHMIVNGRADMTPTPSDEALRHLRLRYRLTATVSDMYFDAGFTVITQDVILGEHLAETTAMIRSRPLLIVVLAPQTDTIAAREAARGKVAGRHPPRPWMRSWPVPGSRPGFRSKPREQRGSGWCVAAQLV
ncbi:MAG: AAA family ATPase [Pseudonocardia sp.]